MSADVQVCVVGGGLNGAAMALALGERGLEVALVDRAEPSRQPGRLGVEIRNVALNPASRSFLDELNAWVPSPHYAHMQVWEETGTARLNFSAAELGRDALGWIVEVSRLIEQLWQRVREVSSIRVLTGAGLSALDQTEEDVAVTLGDEVVRAQLVIAADGGASAVRALSRVAVDERETGHAALATVVRTEQPHEHTAYQRFLRAGPLALLPSADPHLCSVVWSQPPESAQALAELSEPAFCDALTAASGSVLGGVVAADRRFVFPIVQHVAERFDADRRVLLLGDAARVVHPLAGLGVNLGFEDVQGVLGALSRCADPGACDWRNFARRRQARSQAVVRLMSTLQTVYAADSPWFGWARNVGVRAVNSVPGVKAQIMREAMGLGPLSTGMR